MHGGSEACRVQYWCSWQYGESRSCYGIHAWSDDWVSCPYEVRVIEEADDRQLETAQVLVYRKGDSLPIEDQGNLKLEERVLRAKP